MIRKYNISKNHQFANIDIFPDVMQSKSEPIVISNDAIKNQWNHFAPIYAMFDSSMQTFYYTLVNMLNVSKADHILEIASGIGRMIPYAVSLKKTECTYLASDISESMIDLSKKFLDGYLGKLGVSTKVQDWMEKHNLTYKVIDGQKTIQTPYKFDRIICNLVLMITEDPKLMLQNLASVASEGCLLGVTIWGDKQLSNLLTLPQAGMENQGISIPNVRENFHLYNKLEPLALQSGWDVVVRWEQNAPFCNITLDEDLKTLIKSFSGGNKGVEQFIECKVKETFANKNILNFPVQMAILRKK